MTDDFLSRTFQKECVCFLNSAVLHFKDTLKEFFIVCSITYLSLNAADEFLFARL